MYAYRFSMNAVTFFYSYLKRRNQNVRINNTHSVVFGVILVCVFPHLDWIRRDTAYLSVFSPNAVKCVPEELWIWTLFTQCTLVSLWKFQYFLRTIYNPVEHLWRSFYCRNSKPLRIFTEKLHRGCSLGFWIRICFYLKTRHTFYFFKVLYSGTSLRRTSSKADTSLKQTKYFVPEEFLRNPL